jgi:ABC-type multidrug transport system fused ATPase/permease subunit
LITHRLAQIMRADRILVLQHGELVAQGSHEELLATSLLYRQIFVPGERAQDAPRRSVRTPVTPAHE